MRKSVNTGVSFGLTSGTITTLGLMVGLHSGTHDRLAVAGGILVIAIADAFSDALGMHISEESENLHTGRQVWVSTGATFISKFLFALTFLAPVLFLQLSTAIVVSIAWGIAVLSVLSFVVARLQNISPWRVIAEHLLIAIAVITATHFVGDWISRSFK